jgi:hypothetical protein
MTNAERGKLAMQIALDYEIKQGRHPKDVAADKTVTGCDIISDGRYIEVKGVGESWKTYTWQGIHKTEYDRLKSDTAVFYLYIVKFVDKNSTEVEAIYIIPGPDLELAFTVQIASYAITPIGLSKLKPYKV